MNLDAKLQNYLRGNATLNAQPIPAPPFTLFRHREDKSESANFATPDSPLGGNLRESLAQLEQICATHECKAHIRFFESYAPDLALALQACGYQEVGQGSVLICTPASYHPAADVPGLEMVTLSSQSALEEIREGWNANALGWDQNAALATPEETEEFRHLLENCRAFTARLHGQVAGAGMFNPLHAGITEVVGITTLAPFRRRGIASYLTALATQAAFEYGAEVVFLIPEDAEAHRIYERIGYTFYTTLRLYAAKP